MLNARLCVANRNDNPTEVPSVFRFGKIVAMLHCEAFSLCVTVFSVFNNLSCKCFMFQCAFAHSVVNHYCLLRLNCIYAQQNRAGFHCPITPSRRRLKANDRNKLPVPFFPSQQTVEGWWLWATFSKKWCLILVTITYMHILKITCSYTLWNKVIRKI